MILKECKALAMNNFLKFHKLVHPFTNLPVSSDVKSAQFRIRKTMSVSNFSSASALCSGL